MAAPTLCTVVPEDMKARMAEGASLQMAAAHEHMNSYSGLASSNGYVDLHPRSPASDSSRCSTSSSGSSSASSGLLTGDLEPTDKSGHLGAAVEAPALDRHMPLRTTAPMPTSGTNSTCTLPRADIMVLGGDLAYPNPSNETYEKRFFRCRPFCAVLLAITTHVCTTRGWSSDNLSDNVRGQTHGCKACIFAAHFCFFG